MKNIFILVLILQGFISFGQEVDYSDRVEIYNRGLFFSHTILNNDIGVEKNHYSHIFVDEFSYSLYDSFIYLDGSVLFSSFGSDYTVDFDLKFEFTDNSYKYVISYYDIRKGDKIYDGNTKFINRRLEAFSKNINNKFDSIMLKD